MSETVMGNSFKKTDAIKNNKTFFSGCLSIELCTLSFNFGIIKH